MVFEKITFPLFSEFHLILQQKSREREICHTASQLNLLAYSMCTMQRGITFDWLRKVFYTYLNTNYETNTWMLGCPSPCKIERRVREAHQYFSNRIKVPNPFLALWIEQSRLLDLTYLRLSSDWKSLQCDSILKTALVKANQEK